MIDPKVVIWITSMLNTKIIKLDSGPDRYVNDAQESEFVFDVKPLYQWPSPNAVGEYGNKLYDILSKSDPSVQKAIEHVLADQGSLYFFIGAQYAEMHSWEALCKRSGTQIVEAGDSTDPAHFYDFFALQSKWKIARMVKPNKDPDATVVPFDTNLRILATLSATGISGEEQWKSLWNAVETVASKDLPIQMCVLTGEELLLDKLQNHAKHLKNEHVRLTVSDVPDSALGMQIELNRFRPHLVHFFCHGEVTVGKRQLLLADLKRYRAHESFELTLEKLLDTAAKEAWLVILNCCRGAKVAELHSLTHRLVAGGVPAAVGMMEDVDPLLAHKFCDRFYPAALEEIRDAVRALKKRDQGEGIEIEWARAMWAPRAALGDRKPSEERHWTFPVLYVRRYPSQIRLVMTTETRPTEMSKYSKLVGGPISESTE